MVIFYKKWKKYNEIQMTKNKMDLNIRKMTNHPPSPGTSIQPILKSNSTSFMFHNIFSEMKGKNVIHWEGAHGEWGNRPNFVLEV